MKIGIYNPRVGVAKSGGTETFLREMLKRISTDHEVVLYTGEGTLLDEISALDITIRQFPFLVKEERKNRMVADHTPILPAEIESVSMYRNVRSRDGFARLAEAVDVVATFYYLDNILVSRAVSEVPTVFHIPGIKHPSIRWRLMARTARTDRYLASSQHAGQKARDWLGIETDGIVYPGVDAKQFSPDATPAFEREEPVVTYVGRLDEGKGLKDLLQAFDRLEEDAVLYLVGEGTLDEVLRNLARNLALGESVVFEGAVQHDEIHHYYAASDIFCLPSYLEGFPLVNMEAMASGLPVVSTAIDGVEEQIEDGVHGELIEPGDVTELTTALSRLVADPGRRSELGENGRERAVRDFTWDVQARSMAVHLKHSTTIEHT